MKKYYWMGFLILSMTCSIAGAMRGGAAAMTGPKQYVETIPDASDNNGKQEDAVVTACNRIGQDDESHHPLTTDQCQALTKGLPDCGKLNVQGMPAHKSE
jgi:hypothetical protein